MSLDLLPAKKAGHMLEHGRIAWTKYCSPRTIIKRKRRFTSHVT